MKPAIKIWGILDVDPPFRTSWREQNIIVRLTQKLRPGCAFSLPRKGGFFNRDQPPPRAPGLFHSDSQVPTVQFIADSAASALAEPRTLTANATPTGVHEMARGRVVSVLLCEIDL